MIEIDDKVRSTRHRDVFRVREIMVEKADGYDFIVLRLEPEYTSGPERIDLIDNIQPIID